MRAHRLIAALLLASTSLAFAATPSARPSKPAAVPAPYLTIDHSNATLVSATTAKDMWQEQLPIGLVRLYPIKKWGFVSEVEGGFDEAKVCVITARAMMLPRNGKTLVFQPGKTATAFGIRTGATNQQCQELAKAKLLEAIVAVRSSLLPR
jgi:hypothetical protein